MTDEALAIRAKGGDELALRRLLDRHERTIRAVASPYFVADGEREDLLQEARFGAWKAVRDFDGSRNASFRPFLILCVRRQVITAVKAATREKHTPLNHAFSFAQSVLGSDEVDDPLLGETLADSSAIDPVEVLSDRDELSIILAAVLDLTEIERAAIAGPAAGLSYAEVGEVTGYEYKQIDNGRQRGERKIRRALEAAA